MLRAAVPHCGSFHILGLGSLELGVRPGLDVGVEDLVKSVKGFLKSGWKDRCV